ncbi:hypothetical protein WNY59_06960 [Ahrensia kielensis]|uniref:Uncharacterized protein n=1 Tax=Ahrensia kielensis TaxID=76980 RepID=A0ABU9T5B5_9HYPH
MNDRSHRFLWSAARFTLRIGRQTFGKKQNMRKPFRDVKISIIGVGIVTFAKLSQNCDTFMHKTIRGE